MDSADGFWAKDVAANAKRMIVKNTLRFIEYIFSLAKIK
jgi:hypothetical protein